MSKFIGIAILVLTALAGCGGGESSSSEAAAGRALRQVATSDASTEPDTASQSSSIAGTPVARSLLAATPTTTPARKAIFRFFNTSTEAHFFTINAPERNQIIATLPQYRFEDQAYYAMPTASPNYLPVYRFYNTQTLAHFFTIDEGEKNTVLASYPFYRFEGAAWYATTDSHLAASTGALPVYRFFNFKTSTHFYTISEAERVEVQTRYPTQFRFEGLAYYAWSGGQLPVAVIDTTSTATVGSSAALSAASSFDLDGDTLSYAWNLLSAPPGSTASLNAPNTAFASIVPDQPGAYTLQLVVNDGMSASVPVTKVLTVGQAISGTIEGVRTLPNLGYPYTVSGKLIIGPMAGLILAPGVILNGNGQTIQLAGSLKAVGTLTERIRISNLVVSTARVSGAPYLIEIRYADIQGGSLNTVFNDNGTGDITLTDSTIRNTSQEIYLTQPSYGHRVERNVFSSAAGLYFSTSGSQSIIIRNNVFQNWVGDSAIRHGQNLGIFGSPSYDISRNSFLGRTGGVAMRLTNISNAGFSAANNYWGTQDSTLIDSMIIDQKDDLNYPGFITYQPVLAMPDPATPVP